MTPNSTPNQLQINNNNKNKNDTDSVNILSVDSVKSTSNHVSSYLKKNMKEKNFVSQ